MEFKKYQHIERFGTLPVNGIEYGECYIFPKIDGTNASIWENDNFEISCGSRNRELSIDNDNAGFMAWVLQQAAIKDFITKYPNLRLYGEWLVPHTLNTYSEDAWRKFYVFDVMQGEEYIAYEEYKPLLDKFGIEYIVPICKITNPSLEKLLELVEKNFFLIKDGFGVGEGIVIKNYNWKNKFGRINWAKIVRNDFKTKHRKVMGVNEIIEKKSVEEAIVEKYVNQNLIEKEYSKIVNDCGWSSKLIPRLINTVYYCLISEESWNFVKEFKDPLINFKNLKQLSILKIKQIKPELF